MRSARALFPLSNGAPPGASADARRDERRPATPPRTLAELRAALVGGALSVRSLIDAALAAIDAGPASVWISRVDATVLRAQADRFDAELANHGASAFTTWPLLGMPFAVKDNIDVAELPTTAACPGFATEPAARHATVVRRLVDSGAIVLGKTNLDQFATGLVGTRSPYGAVPNPFDARFVSGGSSSGSAYAVAAGQAVFALGTDTAGSGRVPAGMCNIAGLKPTRGWLPTTGVLPACRSLDCVSVFALTPEDAWTVACIAAGPEDADAFSRAARTPLQPVDRVRGLRVGIPRPLEFFGDAQAAAAFDAASAGLRASGCEIVDIDFTPFARVAGFLYDGPWVAERHAAVGDFLATTPPGADATVAAIVARGALPTASALFTTAYELEAIRRDTASLWQRIDVLVVPTAPNHPTQAEVAADPVEPNRRLGHYTNFVNLLDLAAHAVPGPFRADGLPAGITLIGPAFSDFMLAQLATTLMRTLQPTAGAMRHAIGASPLLSAARPTAPMRLVAVGAHMSGLALNGQLRDRAGRLVAATRTAPVYRLHSLTGDRPTRPALVHVGPASGAAIEVEVWELDRAHVGSLLALVGAPLALGSVELADGSREHGFVCEPRGVAASSGATDITRFGGWRGFLASLAG